MSQCIVVTWAEKDGAEPTGETVFRDGCHRPVFRQVWKARAVVWSRDLGEENMVKADAFARSIHGCVRILEDTADVLDRARKAELAISP